MEKIRQRIEKIREKPELERERIVFAAAFGITALLFVFWIYDFTSGSPVPGGTAPEDAPGPWEILTGNVDQVVKDASTFFSSDSSASSTQETGN